MTHPRYRGALLGGSSLGRPLAEGETRRQPLTDDMAGINFEVEKMAGYVRDFSNDPLVVKLVETLVQACPMKDRKCQAATLFAWLKAHFLFLNDPVDREKIKTPHRFVRELETPREIIAWILAPLVGRDIPGGLLAAPRNFVAIQAPLRDLSWVPDPKFVEDCDGSATILATLLAAAGIVPRFRFGGLPIVENGEEVCGWHHVWVQAQLDGGWVDMDVTEPESTFGWFFPAFRCYETLALYKEGGE
jgi:hypothetical protein